VPEVDILQIHDVEFGDIELILAETLPTLNELRSAGKFKYIGITGYDLNVLKWGFFQFFFYISQLQLSSFHFDSSEGKS
jgi:aryl-alcohol dehydrogenase-like predicted oxidoreductase